jgi:glucosylceramidase
MASFKTNLLDKIGLFSLAVVLISGIVTSADAVWVAKIRSTTYASPWMDETAVPVAAAATTGTHVDIDTTAKLQKIDGFGGAFNELGWKAIQSLPQSAADSVIQSLFDTTSGCKFNICRMPIGANDYCLAKVFPLDPTNTNHDADWYSLDETNNDTLMTKFSVARDSAYLLQYIKAAMKYRPTLKVWGSPWSPPLWMKDTHAYNGGSLIWTPTILHAYALYLEKAVQLYQAQGINFFALSFQNEATQLPNYPGCEWTQTQHRDFIKLYLGPKFNTDGVNCEIWTPTMNCSDMSYFDAMLSDPLCASFITTIGFQWAGKAVLDQVNQKYAYPKFKIYQTEQECGSGETGAALWGYAANTVFFNMEYYLNKMASAYMQWNMVLAPGGFSAWGWTQDAMITVDTTAKTVSYNPQYYVAKHFSYYVKPNAKKVTVAGNFSDQVAFQNPDGSIIVVLMNNATSTASVGITFGSNMINVALPPNSFSTAVVYDSTANGVIYDHAAHSGKSAMLKITKRGNTLVLTPGGKTFDIQMLGVNGSVKASFSSKKGGMCEVKTNELSPGIYVLKGLINGSRYFSTIPIVNP